MLRVIVLLSGGIDSATLLYSVLKTGRVTRAVSFNYGQRHSVELSAARQVCAAANVSHTTIAIPRLSDALPNSSLTDRRVAVPEGHYEEESMKATVVANRNMILLAIAAGHAIAHGFDTIAYAAHSGDHAIYPDCRPEFIRAMRQALSWCDWNQVDLETPFSDMTKAQIVMEGHRLGVPFELTWSCYKGEQQHCGKCGTCVERREAFKLAGVPDPTRYAD